MHSCLQVQHVTGQHQLLLKIRGYSTVHRLYTFTPFQIQRSRRLFSLACSLREAATRTHTAATLYSAAMRWHWNWFFSWCWVESSERVPAGCCWKALCPASTAPSPSRLQLPLPVWLQVLLLSGALPYMVSVFDSQEHVLKAKLDYFQVGLCSQNVQRRRFAETQNRTG